MELRQIGSGVQNIQREADSAPIVTEQSVALAKSTATRLETPNPVPKNASVPSLNEVTEAVGKINKSMQAASQNLEFSVDAESDRIIVKVVDKQTQEIIRQLPSKEALEIAKALDTTQGLLIRQKA